MEPITHPLQRYYRGQRRTGLKKYFLFILFVSPFLLKSQGVTLDFQIQFSSCKNGLHGQCVSIPYTMLYLKRQFLKFLQKNLSLVLTKKFKSPDLNQMFGVKYHLVLIDQLYSDLHKNVYVIDLHETAHINKVKWRRMKKKAKVNIYSAKLCKGLLCIKCIIIFSPCLFSYL